MFEIGENVVCINNGKIFCGKFEFKPPVPILKNGKIYTIRNNDGGNGDVLLKEHDNYFDKNRFISLLEYRKMKIQNIKNRILLK